MRKEAFTILALAFCAVFLPCIKAEAADLSSVSSYNNAQTLTFVPVGTKATIMIASPINTKTTGAGSPVNGVLTHDFIYNNNFIAPKGSMVQGTVVALKKMGKADKNGNIKAIFNNITTPQGYKIPVNAVFTKELPLKETEITQGELLNITFTQPITLSAPAEYKYEY